METARHITKRLGEVADIRSGYPFREAISSYPTGELPVIQIRNLPDEQTFDGSTLDFVAPPAGSDKYLIQPGDVLFLAKGQRNFASLTSPEIAGALPASYFVVLRVTDEAVTPAYLSWYLNSPLARRYMRTMVRRGSHMPVMPKEALATVPVPIPPLAMQATIARLYELRGRERILLNQLETASQRLFDAVSVQAAITRQEPSHV